MLAILLAGVHATRRGEQETRGAAECAFRHPADDRGLDGRSSSNVTDEFPGATDGVSGPVGIFEGTWMDNDARVNVIVER